MEMLLLLKYKVVDLMVAAGEAVVPGQTDGQRDSQEIYINICMTQKEMKMDPLPLSCMVKC